MVRALLIMLTAILTATEQAAPAGGAAPLSPQRLAIYYGYPSLVNGASGDIDRAVATFAAYDVVVFGDGLEFADVNPRRQPHGAGAAEHNKTRAIIHALVNRDNPIEVYGYIDLGRTQQLTVEEIANRTRLWKSMGATGVFLDEAGYDFGVTRARQNAVIDTIHSLGLRAFVNAFHPDDVFGARVVPLNSAGGGNPDGAPTRLGRGDAYLLESFQVRLGEAENWSAWTARTRSAVAHRDRFGTRIFAVTTTTRQTEQSAAALYEYAWWSAALWGLDGFGWGEPDFSSATSRLPIRHGSIARRAIGGTRYVGPVIETPQGLERRTDAGRVVLDRHARSGRFAP